MTADPIDPLGPMGPDFVLDLPAIELDLAMGQILRVHDEQPFGTYIDRAGTPTATLAKHVEQEVFWETFRNSPDMLNEEYGPYEDASTFILLLDQRRHVPAGMIRVITPSPVGFKTLNDLPRFWDTPAATALERSKISVDPARTWDVATLAVTKDYRGAKGGYSASLALIQSLLVSATICDVAWVVTVLDVIVLDLLQGLLQNCFNYYKGVGPIRYLDSASSVPVWGDFVKWRARMAQFHSDTHQMFVQGKGLEPVVSHPDEHIIPELFGAAPQPSLVSPIPLHK